MNILETIIEKKKLEVLQRKSSHPAALFEKEPWFSRPVLSFAASLAEPGSLGIIAEFKRKSPSRGLINATASVEAVTAAYTSAGASALSVLTDETFFGGSAGDLRRARVNQVPILRKDFMIDEYQILEARAMGADTILLIAACLSPGETEGLAKFAKRLDLEVLLEIHNQEELKHLCDDIDVVGINNRDLKTFTVDIRRSIELAAALPAGTPRIAESGIRDVDTILEMRSCGFRGFLIGEQFMKEKEPAIAFASFVNDLKNKLYESESLRHDPARSGEKTG
jgi:indole-3-glycerol phosphate synthase